MKRALWPRLREYLPGEIDWIQVNNNYRCRFDTALIVMLFRFSRPRRFRPEMEAFFGMRCSHLSSILKSITYAFELLASQYLSDPSILHGRMPYYAERINAKCDLVDNVWGFIDGTLQKTCRPTYFQRHAYSGHKRCHGLKFQTVITPDGIIATMLGPMNGNRNDIQMIRESKLLA